jgi:hypothetical protein
LRPDVYRVLEERVLAHEDGPRGRPCVLDRAEVPLYYADLDLIVEILFRLSLSLANCNVGPQVYSKLLIVYIRGIHWSDVV